ncbi:MAG: GNAT family N-acetyltransferase [Alphaproteobacteria bacterium]|nr:GNAT family N-acetyltransferase [Alphaproteobacteria bacterium]
MAENMAKTLRKTDASQTAAPNPADAAIVPFDSGQIPAAAKILSKAFNLSARRVTRDLKALTDSFNQATFMATVDGRLVGTVRCHRSDKNPDYFSVSLLAVDPAHRKKGIGHMLMRHAEDFLKKEWMKGAQHYVSLEDSTKHNNPKSRFYEGMGYTQWGDRKGADGDPIFYKWLNAGNS